MGLKRAARMALRRMGLGVPAMLVKPKERMLYAEAARLRPGAVVLDFGANVGKTVEVFADRGAVVHAFEPNADAFRLLDARVGRRPGVHLHQVAVGERNGSARLYLHRDYATGRHLESSSLVSDKDNVDPEAYLEVPVRDVAEVVSAHPRIDLLKIDVEGGEYAILRRLIETGLIERIERVVVETHEDRGPSLRAAHEAIVDLIEARGHWARIRFGWE